MKKFLALVLALIMTFSLGTVAFAAEADAVETTVAEVAPEEEAGALDWLLDLPFWTVGPMSWFAKAAFKVVSAFVKIGIIFGIIDTDAILDQIWDMIVNGKEEAAPEVETTAAAIA